MYVSPSVEFQYLEFLRHRDPGSLRASEACPHCQRELVEYRFCADGVLISTWSCAEHGDVQPMKSVVSHSAPLPLSEAAAGTITQP